MNLPRLPELAVLTLACLAISYPADCIAVPTLPNPTLESDPNGYTETSYDLDTLNHQYSRPQDNPLPPGDSFSTPGTNIQPNALAPVISSYTKQVAKNEAFILGGHNFGRLHQTKVWISDGNGTFESTHLLRHAEDNLHVVLDKSDLAYGMYLAWIENSSGASFPVRLNSTEAWWLGATNAQAGDSLSLFGQNLTHDQSGTLQNDGTSYVYLRPWSSGASTPSQACVVSSANPHQVVFQVPGNLSAGQDYEVWVHNGHGGEYGWSGPLKLHIDSTNPYQWNGTVRNVLHYGANGGDSNDDTASIQAAVNAANSGDRLYFPSGTYRLSSRIYVYGKSLSIYGAGSTSTTIRTLNNTYGSSNMFDVQRLPMEFRDLKLQSTSSTGNSSGMLGIRNSGGSDMANGVIIKNCIFEAPVNTTYAAVKGNWVANLNIHDNTFTGGRHIFLEKTYHTNIHNNTFTGNLSSGAANSVILWGSNYVMIDNNIFRSEDRAQNKTLTRAIVVQATNGTPSHYYVAQNEITGVGPALSQGDFNGGENILFETDRFRFTGKANTIGTNTVQFNGFSWIVNNWVTDDLPGNAQQKNASIIYIQNGKGIGQWRRIMANTSDTIIIDRPWDVQPDSNSRFVIAGGSFRTIIHQNTIDGIGDEDGNSVPDYLERNIALDGIETYGTCMDFVASDNTITRMRRGIWNYSRTRDLGETNVTLETLFHGLFIRNTIDQVHTGILLSNNAFPDSAGSGDPDVGPAIHCNTYRNNQITNALSAITVDRYSIYYFWDWPFQTANLFCNNSLTGTSSPVLQLGREQNANVFHDNALGTTDNSADTSGFLFAPEMTVAHLAANVFDTSITIPYDGTMPWPVELIFNDPNQSPGDAFSSTPNFGWSGGTATGAAYGAGQIQYSAGEVAGGDLGLQFIDANTGSNIGPNGGKLTTAVPSVAGSYTVMLSTRLDGDQVMYDRILDGLGSVRIEIKSAPRRIRFACAGRSLEYTMPNSAWVHLAVSYDHLASVNTNKSVVRFYINGAQVSVSNQDYATASTISATNVTLGAQPSGYRPINGRIDNFMLYDRALTPLEIQDAFLQSSDI